MMKGRKDVLDGVGQPLGVPHPTLDPDWTPVRASRFRARRPLAGVGDVESALRDALSERTGRLVRELDGLWGRQAGALSSSDVSYALSRGDVSEDLIESWREAYSEWSVSHFAPEAIGAAETSLGPFTVGIDSYGHPDAVFDLGRGFSTWLENRSAEMIQDLTDGQREGIRALLVNLNSDAGGAVDARTLAQYMRPMIGLSDRWAHAVTAYIARQIDSGVPRDRALFMGQEYSAFLRRKRADMIARTELARAFNQGAYISILEATGDGGALQGADIKKVWWTLKDERVCRFCGPMHGATINLTEAFPTIDRETSSTPPGHPHCRCVVIYDVVGDSDPVLNPREPDTDAGAPTSEPEPSQDETPASTPEILPPAPASTTAPAHPSASPPVQEAIDKRPIGAARPSWYYATQETEIEDRFYAEQMDDERREFRAFLRGRGIVPGSPIRGQDLEDYAREILGVQAGPAFDAEPVPRFIDRRTPNPSYRGWVRNMANKNKWDRRVEFDIQRARQCWAVDPFAIQTNGVGQESHQGAIKMPGGGSQRELSVSLSKSRKRAAYGGNKILLPKNHRWDEIVHEHGHWVEQFNPRIGSAAKRFLESQRYSSTPERLKDLIPGSGYRNDEVAFDGPWFSPYVGKRYPADQMKHGRDSVEAPASEVLAMGIEGLFASPVSRQRLAQHEDHALFIFATIRGRWGTVGFMER